MVACYFSYVSHSFGSMLSIQILLIYLQIIAPEAISEGLECKIFLGGMSPDPPSKHRSHAIRLTKSILLPTGLWSQSAAHLTSHCCSDVYTCTRCTPLRLSVQGWGHAPPRKDNRSQLQHLLINMIFSRKTTEF